MKVFPQSYYFSPLEPSFKLWSWSRTRVLSYSGKWVVNLYLIVCFECNLSKLNLVVKKVKGAIKTNKITRDGHHQKKIRALCIRINYKIFAIKLFFLPSFSMSQVSAIEIYNFWQQTWNNFREKSMECVKIFR